MSNSDELRIEIALTATDDVRLLIGELETVLAAEQWVDTRLSERACLHKAIQVRPEALLGLDAQNFVVGSHRDLLSGRLQRMPGHECDFRFAGVAIALALRSFGERQWCSKL